MTCVKIVKFRMVGKMSCNYHVSLAVFIFKGVVKMKIPFLKKSLLMVLLGFIFKLYPVPGTFQLHTWYFFPFNSSASIVKLPPSPLKLIVILWKSMLRDSFLLGLCMWYFKANWPHRICINFLMVWLIGVCACVCVSCLTKRLFLCEGYFLQGAKLLILWFGWKLTTYEENLKERNPED